MNFAASSMRRLIISFDSSCPVFDVTRPSTTVLSLGSKRSGSKPPARSESYSMEVAVHIDRLEQDLGNRFVAAACDEIRTEISPAEMHRDGHVGRNVRDGRIDHARIG